MATTILGKVGLTPKGAWAEGTAYERLDVVSNGGSSYMSLSDNNTAALTDTSKWQVLVDATTSIDACNTAKSNAEAATTKAEAVNATLSDDYKFTVTDRNGSAKTLDLASPADVSELNDRFKSYARLKFNVDKDIWVDGVKVTCPANKIVKVYGKKITGIGRAGWSYSDSYTPQLTWHDFSHLDTSQLAKLPTIAREYLGSVKDWSDVANWDTSNVTNMNYQFQECWGSKVDVSKWDTSKVTSMSNMFYNNDLTELNVSGWDTSNVKDMQLLFDGCRSLASLDLSGWDLTNVTNINAMFGVCSSLANIKFGPGWGKQTSTETKALTLNLQDCNSNNNYQLSDETWSSMLTMYDRATAGLTAMTIKIKSTANIPEGWEDSMAALGYTITKV